MRVYGGLLRHPITLDTLIIVRSLTTFFILFIVWVEPACSPLSPSPFVLGYLVSLMAPHLLVRLDVARHTQKFNVAVIVTPCLHILFAGCTFDWLDVVAVNAWCDVAFGDAGGYALALASLTQTS
jgi:hypothetical protein